MVHTFRCLGVNIAVDVNSGAVHVLDGLMYDLLTALAERDESGKLLSGPMPEELLARLPQHNPAGLKSRRLVPCTKIPGGSYEISAKMRAERLTNAAAALTMKV